MKTTWVRIWTLFVALASIIGPAYGANITVDDADPKIIYSSGWSIGNTCTACVAQPDKALTYGATWHDTTRDRNTTVKSVEYSFEGTAIYIYGIIINIVRTDSVFTTNNNLSLWIDGHLASVYQHQPLNTNSYEYDVPVFALSGLSPSTHLARVDLEESSVFLFDYLIYSTPEATSTSSPVASPNTRSVSSATSRSTSNGANSGNDAGKRGGGAAMAEPSPMMTGGSTAMTTTNVTSSEPRSAGGTSVNTQSIPAFAPRPGSVPPPYPGASQNDEPVPPVPPVPSFPTALEEKRALSGR
ncbi:hypothetical protein FRC20_008933 [Serendipita sp. 405]|nr:hypothetical protein FRC20_008933 [Serendipita sp. 405]